MQTFLSFDVSNKAVFMRLLKNKLLAIPTFGFYRFWGKTHLRRLLWQSMRIGEDRLTYHGTAKELFIGFLIAMILLMIVFGVLTFAQNLTFVFGETGVAIGQIANALLLVLFWQFAKYRLWRYRLSRTSYRTIRFFQSGSALKYTLKVLLWAIASIISLGWLYPLMRLKLTQYRVNNMAFGDQHFQFEGRAGPFYRLYWPVVISIYLYIIVPYAFMGFVGDGGHVLPDGTTFVQGPLSVTQLFGISAVLLIISALLWVRARVGEYNYVTSQTVLANAHFKANLPIGKILVLGFVGLLIICFLIAIAIFWFYSAFFLVTTTANSMPEAFLVSFALVIVVLLLVDVLIFMILFIPIVRLISEYTYVSDTGVFNQVAASSVDSPKYGEGLADALDVGAF
ncbi:YjgN family protein [Sneathiella glossodoripedis]|uniref:YjgN family protein n=1 Tax=Sneathiella glossodoripedis TaxID=418853 RepID=UPI000471F0BD|nr:DUF898 family protein [Sneathiella glossodoripedis]